ncbi:MAG: hypothetical protein U0491_00320 [Candidatus Saccharimonadales bacterium]
MDDQTKNAETSTVGSKGNQNSLSTQITTGEVNQKFFERKSKRTKLLILVSIILLFLFLVGGTLIFVQSRNKKNQPKVTIDKPLEQQTQDEVKTSLKADTGLDVDKLKSTTITAKTYSSGEQAYKAAQSLNAIGSYDKAIESYTIAAASTQNYEFYLNYSAAADSAGNTKLGSEMLQKARDILQADNTMDAQKKQILLDELDQKIKFRKLNNI